MSITGRGTSRTGAGRVVDGWVVGGRVLDDTWTGDGSALGAASPPEQLATRRAQAHKMRNGRSRPVGGLIRPDAMTGTRLSERQGAPS